MCQSIFLLFVISTSVGSSNIVHQKTLKITKLRLWHDDQAYHLLASVIILNIRPYYQCSFRVCLQDLLSSSLFTLRKYISKYFMIIRFSHLSSLSCIIQSSWFRSQIPCHHLISFRFAYIKHLFLQYLFYVGPPLLLSSFKQSQPVSCCFQVIIVSIVCTVAVTWHCCPSLPIFLLHNFQVLFCISCWSCHLVVCYCYPSKLY